MKFSFSICCLQEEIGKTSAFMMFFGSSREVGNAKELEIEVFIRLLDPCMFYGR